MIKAISSAASLLMLATTVMGACETISYTTCADNIVHWYDPSNGEVCDPLDCGGGRAPVKYDVPCCAAYRGTEPCVSTTSTLSCWKPSSALASSTVASTSAEATDATVTESAVASTSNSAPRTSESDTGSSTAPMTTTAPTTTNTANKSKSEETSSGSAASSESATSSDASVTNSSAAPVSTNNAGGFVGSLKAVVGAAIGAIVLV